MRGKRSKQYRKLMEQFSMTFGFREPYQILVDAEMIHDASRFKMDLAASLERTVHGKAKPMITQCEIRQLYNKKNEPGIREAIELAKTLERRRCGHHPDKHPEPLDATECMLGVVDPGNNSVNKHRYVVASQSQPLRQLLRGVRGVPLIYIKRSVMILEPMADESVQVRAREERAKFRAEIKTKPVSLGKRKREGADETEDGDNTNNAADNSKKKKKNYGPAKGPNPLSVKKKQKPSVDEPKKTVKPSDEVTTEEPAKRKRKRKSKKKVADGETNGDNAEMNQEPNNDGNTDGDAEE